MATPTTKSRVDPISGFDPITRTYQSLRPEVPLPPITQPLSITQFATSLLLSSSPTAASLSSIPVLVDTSTGRHVSYSLFLSQIHSLSSSLSAAGLRRGQTAFILSPGSPHVPVVFLSLMSLGVVVSPANPLGSESEIRHQVSITRPDVAFATSKSSSKLPGSITRVIILDSPEFLSMIEPRNDSKTDVVFSNEVQQSDPAAILFSSGTTGRVKGVTLTHRNLISITAGLHASRQLEIEADPEGQEPHPVSLMFIPMFHVFGFFMLVRAVALGETAVVMERFDFEAMLRAVERYRVTYMPASPPLVVAMVKSDLVGKYDLSSLTFVGSGGAPLGEEVAERFRAKFPNVEIAQGYGLTETTGSVTRWVAEDGPRNVASVGKLAENMEAKIVDPVSGEPLPPGHRGELWLRGPLVMKGYVGDEKATAETLDSDGWLKTGDLCMFDSEGFLYIVDRLKELIKYKAYQVPPAELEQLLQSQPEIADAAVIPYPDEDAGEIPMAYVVRKSGSNLSAAQVMDFVAKKVAPYKKVRRVAFVDAIPKSPAGKILRRELVNHALTSGKSKL